MVIASTDALRITLEVQSASIGACQVAERMSSHLFYIFDLNQLFK